MNYTILTGDNRLTLKTLADDSIDAIVTDPPYGIDFLGKSWDANTGALETYQECLRVLKPGGHILAFSAARTYHHLAVTLEQAGFEIRDQIMWIYSSGFPKSQDIGKSIDRTAGKKNNLKRHDSDKKDNNGLDLGSGVRCPECGKDSAARYACDKGQECGMVYKPQTKEAKQWAGWGTALKPAHEPIALARKPIKLSIARNAQQWGTGALNIDACRVPYANEADLKTYINNIAGPLERSTANEGDGIKMFEGKVGFKVQKGTVKRLPSAGKRTASFHNATGGGETVSGGDGSPEFEANPIGRFPSNVVGEILQADYQKYFYCPKVSRRERHIGHEMPAPMFGDVAGAYGPDGNRMAVGLDARGIKTHWQMAEEMGGSLVDHEGNPTRSGNKALIPGVGDIYTHSLSKKYEDWCKQNNKSMPNVGNNHPTVKPIELMKYLIKLVTPPGGTVLDPFNGSGSTGCAAVELGHTYIGCELDDKYVKIAQARIEAWYAATRDPAREIFEQ